MIKDFPFVVLLSSLIGISGCGPGDGRMPVQGSVMLDGNPMNDAAISFRPARGTKGPSSGGPIQQGQYRISATSGLLPGTYDVTIVAMKETGRTINDPQKGPIPELVQVRFRQPLGQVTVESEASNEFDFDVTSVP